MIYFILWYVIGIISYLTGEKLFEREIRVKDLFQSLLTGFGGLGITAIVLAIQFDWGKKVRNFMDKEIL